MIGKGSETPDLQMFGSQITLEDNTPPTATITGGILAGTGTLTGTQSLSYTASDPLSGVRQVKLLIDGVEAAANTYTSQCPYQNFLACPANITDTINWNTTSVTDGQHSLQVLVEDAAQNTTVFYHATITTHNAPTLISPPLLTTPTQLQPADPLSIQPGSWSAPPGAGTITYTYQWQDCDTQANNCQAIPGAQNTTYTPTASDIGHTMRALVSAADNDGTSTQTSITTNVVTAAAQVVPTSSTPQAAGESQASNPSSTGIQTGMANGTPASQTAILKLNGAHAIYEPYAHRAFKITGQLLTSQEQPIAGATLDVLEQTSGSDTVTLLQHATTRPNGTFTTAIPPGPSRRIAIAYRAFTNDPDYATTTSITETVGAGVHITITPGHTGSTGTIKVKGIVYGPIPPQGALVHLHVYWRGSWLTIRTPRTNRHGEFHIEYQFNGAIGQFPFQATIPLGQTDFPYTDGRSNIVTVTTN